MITSVPPSTGALEELCVVTRGSGKSMESSLASEYLGRGYITQYITPSTTPSKRGCHSSDASASVRSSKVLNVGNFVMCWTAASNDGIDCSSVFLVVQAANLISASSLIPRQNFDSTGNSHDCIFLGQCWTAACRARFENVYW